MEQRHFEVTIGSTIFIFTLRVDFTNPFFNIDILNVQNHNHISYEFTYVINGCCSITANGVEHHIEQNQYFIVGSNVYHSQKAIDKLQKISFRFQMKSINTTDTLMPSEENQLILNNFINKDFLANKDDGKVLGLIKDIQREVEYPKIGFYTNVRSLLTQLIVKIVRDSHPNKPIEYIAPKKSFNDAVTEIENFLYEHSYEKISISDLAQCMNFSTRQVERIIKKKFNMTFKQKIIEKRIDLAKSFLETTDEPIKKIAEKVGYDASNFSAFFKKNTGVAPQVYRNKYRDQQYL